MRMSRIALVALLVAPIRGYAAPGNDAPPPPLPVAPTRQVTVADERQTTEYRRTDENGNAFDDFGHAVTSSAKTVGRSVETGAKRFGRAVSNGWDTFRRDLTGDR